MHSKELQKYIRVVQHFSEQALLIFQRIKPKSSFLLKVIVTTTCTSIISVANAQTAASRFDISPQYRQLTPNTVSKHRF